jgi:outer membrane lipoprotein-sorting protein
MKRITIFALLGLFIWSAFTADQASDILAKVDKNMMAIKDKTANVEMQMINLKNGSKKIKRAMLYQKGLDKKLFRYTYPESDKGIASLTISGAVYLYLPMFKKPKKVTNMAEGNTFNKSDFSLADMVTKPYSELYTPKLLKTTATAYILDLIPKDPENSPYKHLVATINKQYYYPEKFEYYDKKNVKVKEAVNKYEKVQGLWIAQTVTMTNLKKNHRTIFIMNDIKLNTGLKNDLFTVENMVEQ